MGSGARPVAGSLSVEILPATAQHVADILRIERACFSDPWSEQSFRALVGNPDALFLVAAGADGRIVGYTAALDGRDDGEILNVAVAADARQQGIGGLLLDAAMRTLKMKSVKRLYLEARESNAAALSLYESRGFVRLSIRRNYYRRPVENALVLMLDLSAP
jgi:[ribosomal protein S18]-alanine N-acetyltransferase